VTTTASKTTTVDAAAQASIGAAARELHLPTVRTEATRLAEIADRERHTHLRYLAEVLADEVDDAPNGARPDALTTPQGRRVRYATTAQLVNELVEAADERVLSRVVARYGRLDLLCLDELGYVEIDPRGAELLFQIITEREERASVAIATNLPFSKAHLFTRTCAKYRRNITGSSPASPRSCGARLGYRAGIPTNPLPLGLILRCACDGEDGARHQFGVVKHRFVANTGEHDERRLG
jgi:hypothetical protein